MAKKLNTVFAGTRLVRRDGSREKYTITRVLNTSPGQQASRVYVKKEGLKSEEVWDNHCVFLEDLWKLFELDTEDDEGLDI